MSPATPIAHATDRPWMSGLLIGCCALGCVVSVLAGIAPLIVWGSLAVCGVLIWCFMSPVWGLCLMTALSFLFLRSTEYITWQEVVYAVLCATVISGWVARRLAAGQSFAVTWIDRVLIWFLLIGVLSIVPAVLYGNALLKWFREFIPFLMFVPYLVVVTTVRRTRQVRWLCLSFVLLGLIMGVLNLIEYRTNVVNARYVWELLAGRRALNEPLFFTSLTILMTLVAFEGFRGWRTVGYFTLILFFIVALAVTFSRGYWVATGVALLVAFPQIPARRRRAAIGYLVGLTLAGLGLALLLAGPIVVEIASVVAERFGSITGATLDISIKQRLAESTAVLRLIAANPVVGYGLGFLFSFYSLIPAELPTFYVHNVYLYIWLKLGVFGLATFLVFYLSVLVHGYRAYRSLDHPFLKPLVLGIVSVMIAMLPLSLSSPQFIQKDSILFLSLGMGIVELAYRDTRAVRVLES
ncbi:MAG: O-antigen ligase family protein [Candidatus Latescibacteria bacterium]|nr:O-antigen ligase family protein [Candidatus Latescibacterota bacterium]